MYERINSHIGRARDYFRRIGHMCLNVKERLPCRVSLLLIAVQSSVRRKMTLKMLVTREVTRTNATWSKKWDGRVASEIQRKDLAQIKEKSQPK
jgi:hypothetical protein